MHFILEDGTEHSKLIIDMLFLATLFELVFDQVHSTFSFNNIEGFG